MEYILIEEEKERIAIALNTVRSIHKADFTKSSRRYLYLERDTGDFNRFVVNDFEVREMSGLELTEWLKGEQKESKDDEHKEKSPLEDTLEKMGKAFKEANWNFKESAKKIIEDIEPSDEDIEWQQYKQALKTINNSGNIGVVIPQPIKDWLEHQINACWAAEELYKQLGEDNGGERN